MPPVVVETMDTDDHPPLVLIRADNQGVTVLTALLKTINFCEKVNICIAHSGIRFAVEEGAYVQALLYMKVELFKTYNVPPDAQIFKVPFKELLDCMKILGADGKISGTGGNNDTEGTLGSTVPGGGAATIRSLQITYNGPGSSLCLALDEPGMYTELELKTEEEDPLQDFDELLPQWEIIMDAKLLQEFLVDLEGYGPEYVTLRVVPNTCVEFRANGVAGTLKISIPKNCDRIEKFCTVKEPHQATYRFNILRHCFKLIQSADKVVLRMLEAERLNLSVIFKDTLATCADFFVVPQADDNEGGIIDDTS